MLMMMMITLSKKILDNYNADDDDDDDYDDDHLVQDPWQQQHRGWPVTGVIVEPIQAEGGDHHGSNAWFQVYNNSY